jgi:hypothetical protein
VLSSGIGGSFVSIEGLPESITLASGGYFKYQKNKFKQEMLKTKTKSKPTVTTRHSQGAFHSVGHSLIDHTQTLFQSNFPSKGAKDTDNIFASLPQLLNTSPQISITGGELGKIQT